MKKHIEYDDFGEFVEILDDENGLCAAEESTPETGTIYYFNNDYVWNILACIRHLCDKRVMQRHCVRRQPWRADYS